MNNFLQMSYSFIRSSSGMLPHHRRNEADREDDSILESNSGPKSGHHKQERVFPHSIHTAGASTSSNMSKESRWSSQLVWIRTTPGEEDIRRSRSVMKCWNIWIWLNIFKIKFYFLQLIWLLLASLIVFMCITYRLFALVPRSAHTINVLPTVH